MERNLNNYIKCYNGEHCKILSQNKKKNKNIWGNEIVTTEHRKKNVDRFKSKTYLHYPPLLLYKGSNSNYNIQHYLKTHVNL